MADTSRKTGSKILTQAKVKKSKKKGRPTDEERGNFRVEY